MRLEHLLSGLGFCLFVSYIVRYTFLREGYGVSLLVPASLFIYIYGNEGSRGSSLEALTQLSPIAQLVRAPH